MKPMNLSPEIVYAIAGGGSVIVLDRVFAFIKFMVDKQKASGNGKGDAMSPEGVQLLILKHSQATTLSLNGMSGEMKDIRKTVEQLDKKQGEINGDYRVLSEAMTAMLQDTQMTRKDCMHRFGAMEKALGIKAGGE